MNEDWISEAEASIFSGVAISSLNRFAKAGYIQVSEDCGQRLFHREDLERIFGLAGNTKKQPEKLTRLQTDAEAAKKSLKNRIELLKTAAPIKNRTKASRQLHPAHLNAAPLTTIQGISPSPEDYSEKRVERLTRRLTRLRHTIQSQKQALNLKESRISDLKEQRGWLRSRIEKLEEKGDRDQLLLLSETQTLTRLLTTTYNHSPFRLALGWLGFGSSTEKKRPQNSTIEL